MVSKVLSEPAFVGREWELAELEHCLEFATEGKGTTVLVSGEAGTGKTRLISEFLNRARKQGVTVLTGWCLSNAAVPYFPFFEAFNTFFKREYQPLTDKREVELTTWLMGQTGTENIARSNSFSPQVWKDQTFVAVARTLSTISAKKPVVLFIDDIQSADSASLALIHYIARATKSEKILLLATFRSDQLIPDAEGRPHLLNETLRLMRREDLVEEIKIINLNEETTSKLAKNILGGEMQQELAEKLANRSQGNPLFIVESLRMLLEHNSLVQDQDQWRLTAEYLGIPSKIKDIILQRLGTLPRNQREVLDAASIIGEKFDVTLLASILNQDPLELAKELDEVAKNTYIVSCDYEICKFDHARSRDTIYEEISPLLKKGYHNRVAEKLESIKEDGEQLLSEIAYHYAQAGNKERARKYALAAGQDALSKWSNAEAIKQFSYVLQTKSESSDDCKMELTALEGLGDAFYASNMFRESLKPYEELANKSELGIIKLRALRKAMESAFQLSDPSQLMYLVKKAEPYITLDKLESARILVARGRVAHLQSDFSSASRDMETALQVFEEEFSLLDVAFALSGLSVYHASWGGKLKEGLAEALRVVALFDEFKDYRQAMRSRWLAGLAFTNDLLIPEAMVILTKLAEIDEKLKMGDYTGKVYGNCQLSRCYMVDEDLPTALSFSMKALEFSNKTDGIVPHGMVYSDLILQLARLGDLKRAEEFFERLMKLPKELIIHPLVKGTLAMAVFYASKNQWEESNCAFEQQFEWVNTNFYPAEKLSLKRNYAWAQELQGHFMDSKKLIEDCKKIRQEAEERFDHADLQAHLIVRKHVIVGEDFEMRLDLVNVGRKPALLVEALDLLPGEFKIISSPSWCNVQNSVIIMEKEEVAAFQVTTAKLTLKSLKAGTFTLHPRVVYIDNLGETKSRTLQQVIIIASQPALKERVAGKVKSGTQNVDQLLLGGLPEKNAIILAGTSSDERSLFIKRFLKEGYMSDDVTFYITTNTTRAGVLAAQSLPNFYLFVCNPQADAIIPSFSNVFKIKGIENLTELDIALTKAFRVLNPSIVSSKRICIDIISDILLQHHAVTTRRWLSALLPTLKSRGFTVLAVVDPAMHPSEELQAVLGVFDGEIRITEKEMPEGTRQTLKVRRLINQKYSDKEITLNKEALSN